MTRDEFFSALKRRPVGVICNSCRNVVSIDTTESLRAFLKDGTFTCPHCGMDIKFKGYLFQNGFIFSFRPNISSRTEDLAKTFFVDFEKTIIYNAKEADFLKVGFKYKDVYITFLLE